MTILVGGERCGSRYDSDDSFVAVPKSVPHTGVPQFDTYQRRSLVSDGQATDFFILSSISQFQASNIIMNKGYL